MIEFIDDTARTFDVKHFADPQRGDRPVCGVSPAGRFVVEAIRHVDCPACIAMSNVPRPRRAAGGSS